ncbi:hypothetical protein B0H66DRAFT_555748 [Apodospora peruviana]|uniref:Uncharacterized protein n=1 Tax=Apodospora peruviana TaxID=516989 RepID=A0AAE0IDI3_9PEZI|nr:hypothetical protein B0H66DRAFT_555748 [Apodospora peruviana]
MLATRSLTRAAPRAARTINGPRAAPRRFQSSTTNAPNSSSSHFGAGVIGGVVGASLLYGVYLVTPTGKAVRKVNKVAKEADAKYQQIASTLKEKTPSADDAISKIKEMCYTYVFWIPGGRDYVDAAFKDLESVRENNREEADKLVDEAYHRFQDIAAAGLSIEALSRTYEALKDLSQKLAKLAGNSVDQILENHPQLKDKVGGPIEQLKQMGEQYGPEAKKMVDDTWNQVGEVMAGGFSAQNLDKVRRLVEEKSQQLKDFGDKAWSKGLEQAKPYLDKNPKLKELINDNQDILKQGNATELFKRVKGAAENGDMGSLEDYVKKAADKAKSSGISGSSLTGGAGSLAALGQFFGMPQQGKLKENIQVMSKVIEEHASEGEDLLKETKDKLQKVLEEQAKKAQKIVESAQKKSSS